MKKLWITVAMTCAALAGLAAEKENMGSFKTVLVGMVEDTAVRYMVLTDDLEREEPKINVNGGRFEYILEGDHVLRYALVKSTEYENGQMMPTYFFPDRDTVRFVFSKDGGYTVDGGDMYRKMKKYGDELAGFWNRVDVIDSQMEALRKEGKLFSKEFCELQARWDTMERSLFLKNKTNL